MLDGGLGGRRRARNEELRVKTRCCSEIETPNTQVEITGHGNGYSTRHTIHLYHISS